MGDNYEERTEFYYYSNIQVIVRYNELSNKIMTCDGCLNMPILNNSINLQSLENTSIITHRIYLFYELAGRLHFLTEPVLLVRQA